MTALWIVLAVLLLIALWVVLTYNGLIGSRNRVDEAWSDIDVQLKRRHDLVPNLVETVKGYAAHEQATFERVTEARSRARAAASLGERAEAERQLAAGIGAINAVAEQYPQLRATENFQTLQAQLAELEDEIQGARRIYNSNVRSYQTRKQVFPNSLLVGLGDFPDKEYFELDSPAERAVPAVSF